MHPFLEKNRAFWTSWKIIQRRLHNPVLHTKESDTLAQPLSTKITSVAGTIEYTCNQKMLGTLYYFFLLTALSSFNKLWARQQPQSWPLNKISSSLQLAELLNKAHIHFQSKFLSWILDFGAMGSWDLVSVTNCVEPARSQWPCGIQFPQNLKVEPLASTRPKLFSWFLD